MRPGPKTQNTMSHKNPIGASNKKRMANGPILMFGFYVFLQHKAAFYCNILIITHCYDWVDPEVPKERVEPADSGDTPPSSHWVYFCQAWPKLGKKSGWGDQADLGACKLPSDFFNEYTELAAQNVKPSCKTWVGFSKMWAHPSNIQTISNKIQNVQQMFSTSDGLLGNPSKESKPAGQEGSQGGTSAEAKSVGHQLRGFVSLKNKWRKIMNKKALFGPLFHHLSPQICHHLYHKNMLKICNWHDRVNRFPRWADRVSWDGRMTMAWGSQWALRHCFHSCQLRHCNENSCLLRLLSHWSVATSSYIKLHQLLPFCLKV